MAGSEFERYLMDYSEMLFLCFLIHSISNMITAIIITAKKAIIPANALI